MYLQNKLEAASLYRKLRLGRRVYCGLSWKIPEKRLRRSLVDLLVF